MWRARNLRNPRWIWTFQPVSGDRNVAHDMNADQVRFVATATVLPDAFIFTLTCPYASPVILRTQTVSAYAFGCIERYLYAGGGC